MDLKPKINTKTFDVLMNTQYLPITIGILLSILFGMAIYLVHIDLEKIKAHLYANFNEQQLILTRQAASHVDTHLNALERELRDIKWLFDKNEKDLGISTLKEFLIINSGMGILDAGVLSPEGEIQAYSKVTPTIPALNVEKALTEYNRYGSFGVILGDLKIYNTGKAKMLIANLIVPLKSDSAKPDILFARLDVSTMLEMNLGRLSSDRKVYAWVIDKNGRALYHPEKDFIGENIFEVRYETKPVVSFPEMNNLMKQNMMKGREGKSRYESWWHRGRKERVVELTAFAPIKNKFISPDRIWSIAVVAPASEVSDVVNSLYPRILGGLAAIVIGIFFFAIIMIRYNRKISFIFKEQVTEKTEKEAPIPIEASIPIPIIVPITTRLTISPEILASRPTTTIKSFFFELLISH